MITEDEAQLIAEEHLADSPVEVLGLLPVAGGWRTNLDYKDLRGLGPAFVTSEGEYVSYGSAQAGTAQQDFESRYGGANTSVSEGSN